MKIEELRKYLETTPIDILKREWNDIEDIDSPLGEHLIQFWDEYCQEISI